LGSVGFDNVIKIYDVEQSKAVYSHDLPDLPYYFDWNSDGSRIAVVRKDKYVSILDPRDAKSEIKAEGLDPKPSRCVWADAARKLVVTGVKGGSRVIALFDPRKFTTPLTVTDVDSGGSVLCPFYDPDNSVLYLPAKGDATIRYYEMVEKDDNDQHIFYLSEFRDNESAKGGCFLPKSACDVKQCEVAIFYRLLRDWVSPVSFTVPRKSDQFQADLFPDTYHSPSLDAKDYASYANKEHKAPVKRSMKPGVFAEAAAPQRTKEDVERELDIAKAKVAALQLELSKFK
jgi:coronin-1B/1C/6